MEVDDRGRRPRDDPDSDSEDEYQAPKRQKRHKFKKFAERVKDVDVDVYRSLGPKRAEPLAGTSSFFEERLGAWRELCAAADWLEAASALHSLTQSLPQLLHHQTDILDILLSRVRMDAALSLQPLLELLGALARDLQADFLPHVPRVLSVCADLVDAGADREPELLQHVFTACSLICKHLVRELTPDLSMILSSSMRLRYHRAPHVRALAAQAFGFLLRQAPPASARAAVRQVLADAVVRPSVARLNGAGLLIAEAAAGVGNGLHSRAPALLELLLRQDLLTESDFGGGSGGAGASAKKRKKGTAAAEDGVKALSREFLAARIAGVAAQCLDHLLNHVRRGPGVAPLWSALLNEATARLDAARDAPDDADTKADAARGVALLCRAVEYHRGSRVETYTLLFDLARRLASAEVVPPPTDAQEAPKSTKNGGKRGKKAAEEEKEAAAVDAVAEGGPDAEVAAFLRPSLSGQALRFLQALVYSHCKVVSASEGPAAIERAAPLWAGVLARAPRAEVLPFVRALITPPAGPEVSRAFAPHALAAVGRALLAPTSAAEADACWPLLMDLCSAFGGAAGSGNVVPVLLTAGAGVGPKLAKLVCETVQSYGGSGSSDDDQVAAAARAWAALHCLPHAVPKPEAAAAHVETLLKASGKALKQATPGSASAAAALALHCAARAAAAAAAQAQRLPVGAELIEEAVMLAEAHPSSYHALHAAAETLDRGAADGAALPSASLLRLAPLLEANLSQPSAPLRVATLRLLCAFQQPPALPAAGSGMDVSAPAQPSDVLPQLLAVHSLQLGPDGGRPAIVALGRVKTALEFKRVPAALVAPVVRALLGALHIRFAPLWPAANAALAQALDSYPETAWPLIFGSLTDAQAAFLGGDFYAGPGSDGHEREGERAHEGSTSMNVPSLTERFEEALVEGGAAAGGGSTDAAARLTHLLRALAAADYTVVESKFRDWIPLFLAFSSAKSPDGVAVDGGADEEEEEEDEEAAEDGEGAMEIDAAAEANGNAPNGIAAVAAVSPRAWRSALRDWLAALASLRGLRGTHRAAELQAAVASHVMDIDPFVQAAALRCLKAFKLPWLAPYLDRLLRLADNKTLRAELAAFPLGITPTSVRQSDDVQGILAEHRATLVPLLVALLFPKMRKRSGRLGGKGAPGSARAAILNFLAAAEPHELRPLLELFLGPLGAVFVRLEGFKERAVRPDDPVPGPGQGAWWGRELGCRDGAFWLATIDAAALNSQPLRRRVGYLNTLEDLLKHLGHRMEAFLPELLALAVVLLEGAVTGVGPTGEAAGEQEEGAKEVRARCLRLVAAAIERFPGSIDYSFLWPRLLTAAAPLMERLAVEAAADRPPALIDIVVALTASQHKLVGVLADGVVVEGAGGAAPRLRKNKEAWAAKEHLGSRLLERAIAALSAPTCAEPTRVAMLGALEGIFDLEDPLPEAILGSHTPALLEGLQAIVVAVWRVTGRQQSRSKLMNAGRRGGGGGAAAPPRRATATRALAILELVGGRASDWTTAAQLTDAMLPLLAPQGGGRRKAADEELVARALGALTALWSRLGAAAQASGASAELEAQQPRLRAIATAAAPLAGALNTRDARATLCTALTAVAALLPELSRSAELLQGLNAYSTTEIDEADYEARMAAYVSLTPETWGALSALSAAPLVQHCARDLRNGDDLALRHAAAQALANLIDAAGSASEDENNADVVAVVHRQVFPQLKRSLGASSLAVRQEHLALVRRAALALPTAFSDLSPLTHADPEADFWLNAAHLQLHRRARAFSRLARLLRSSDGPQLSLGVLVGLLAPLLQQAVLEGKVDGDETAAGHEAKQADVDRGANVVDAAVGALGALAGALPWSQYRQALGQWLRLMGRHAEGPAAKPVLRAVCGILDAFHFLSDEDEEMAAAAAQEGEPSAEIEEDAGEEEEEEEAEEDGDKAAAASASALPPRSEVYALLLRRVVPELRGQLVSGETVRAPVAQALVKVLKLLPPASMRLELPRTLQSVANLLKLRLQRLRDDARGVLVAMASDLGPEYLPFTIEVLRSALPDKGFTAHVLGYTVHAVLEGVAPAARDDPSTIDDCLPMILPIVEAQLFGAVAEAKEVDAFAANYKEAKRNRANDTYQLLAATVTFGTHVPALLKPVRERLGQASHPKTRSRLTGLLTAASAGLLANATATPRDLCELTYAIADAGLAAEEAARAEAAAAAGAAARGAGAEGAADEARAALHQPMLVEFALTTFKAALKKGLIPTSGPDSTALLDPILPLLIRALRSRHSPSVTAALQALSILILHADLPGLDAASADAGKAVTDLLKRCPKTTHPVAQDCFKLLAGMLRRCERYAPSPSQLRFLLGWAFTDLEESAERQTAFALLRAILARKLVLPEVYDLMERVQELVVRSQAAQVRQLAAAALLAFLLDYPLGPKRLDGHLQFLLANLSYEHETGREAALSMLSAVIAKFPAEVVAGWAETLFLPLLTRLVNDQSAKCRASAGACARSLLGRLPAPRRDALAGLCGAWLAGRDARLVRASAQALGIFAEVEGAGFARRVPELLPTLAAVLADRAAADEAAAAADEEEEGDLNIEPGAPASAAPGWQEAYYCLTLLEKVLSAAPEAVAWSAGAAAQGCWTAAQRLLLHRHAWVRRASGRLVGAGLAAPGVGPPLLAAGDASLPGALGLSFFRQLESPAADEGLAGQAIKCLVFLSLPMFEADEGAGRVPAWRAAKAAAATAEAEEEADEEAEAAEDAEEAAADADAAEEAAAGSLSLAGLVRRVSRLADDKSFVRQMHRGAALRFIAAVASRLGAARVEPYLPVLLRPLYRLTEPGAAGNPEAITTLGDEIMAHLRALLGSDVLLAGYNAAREAVRRARGERRRRAAVQTMVDPEAAARRKIRAAERKKEGKRKALEEVRRMRSAGVVVKNKRGGGRGGGRGRGRGRY